MAEKGLFGESNYIEFKAQIPKRHESFLKDIIAFANSSGGKIIIGVEDGTGRVIGIGEENPFRLSDSISNMISDSCIPHIYTEISVRTLEEKTILEIEVFPGKQRPYHLASVGKEKSTYIRINGTSRPAASRRLKELEMEGLKVSFDMLPEIGTTYDKKKVEELCDRMYKTAVSACLTEDERKSVKPMTPEKLEDFGILQKHGHDYQLTHGFFLLTTPTVRSAKIQCAVFKGVKRDEFIDRKEMRGAVQEQLEMAQQFVLRHINLKTEIKGLKRIDSYELPVESIREIIANAVIHRSYMDEACIQISLFDDRLEIDSPGTLYDGLTVSEAVAGKSRCRNAAVAEAFQYMKLIENWGTGLPRLFKRCQEMGLPTPLFEENGDGIKVTIFYAVKTTQSTTQTTQSTTQSDKHNNSFAKADLSDTELIILTMIAENQTISQQTIAERLNININLIKYYIRRLKNNGKLIREGTNKSGRWIICSEYKGRDE